ncbi:manganese-dependent inorganic pyrophosphatase [candidate division WWE3 bacterium]|nr:manganese-dependent inorganic pyrophosphatase [candidate division WWE3 bacterium]
MTTYIIGHQKPDLDAVAAPMALAYLFQNNESFGYTMPTPVIAHDVNNETKWVLERFGVAAPELFNPNELTDTDKVILVDHNEESQRADGIPPHMIVEIVDHHKFNLNVEQPLHITAKPWGSSSTIVWWMMQQAGVKPNKQIAALMLCAILSDTVGFKSATTTDADRTAAEELGSIAEISDIDALTLDIFRAKSDISNLTPQQIVTNDYKVFDFNGFQVLIDQIETVQQDEVLSRRVELLEAMAQVKAQENTNYIFVAISDIIRVNTKLLVVSQEEREIAEQAFNTKALDDNVLDIGPMLSRKKEIAPAIESVLSN